MYGRLQCNSGSGTYSNSWSESGRDGQKGSASGVYVHALNQCGWAWSPKISYSGSGLSSRKNIRTALKLQGRSRSVSGSGAWSGIWRRPLNNKGATK